MKRASPVRVKILFKVIPSKHDDEWQKKIEQNQMEVYDSTTELFG